MVFLVHGVLSEEKNQYNHLWPEVFRSDDINFFVHVSYQFEISEWYSDGVFILLSLLLVTEQYIFM